MYTPYLLILTMFSGAGEIIDPVPHASIESCRSELVRMRSAVENEWAAHGVLRTKGECRPYDRASWSHVAERRSPGAPTIAERRPASPPAMAAAD